jgi:hypothetical protein
VELIVFAGPSLGSPDSAAMRRIDFRPPARCGDITRVVGSRPAVIGLIDGVFETTAAVWHKEIVYALSEGVVVFGAASMGALRAVELEPFGMIGIGDIFRAYRDGEIEDDDEVAVQHGPAELGYPPLTEAMVNVRATCDAAAQAGILLSEERAAICCAAKSLFYKYRTWGRILADGAAGGVADEAFERFAQWRVANTIDVKRRDALRLVDAVLNHCPGPAASRIRPTLNRTVYWVSHEERFGSRSTRDAAIGGDVPRREAIAPSRRVRATPSRSPTSLRQ